MLPINISIYKLSSLKDFKEDFICSIQRRIVFLISILKDNIIIDNNYPFLENSSLT